MDFKINFSETVILGKQDFIRKDIWEDLVDVAKKKGFNLEEDSLITVMVVEVD